MKKFVYEARDQATKKITKFTHKKNNLPSKKIITYKIFFSSKSFVSIATLCTSVRATIKHKVKLPP